MAQNRVGQIYVGEKPVYGRRPPGIPKNQLDFWYDYGLGSYNANYSSSNLAPSIGAYLDFEMSLSGSGTNPTYDTATTSWAFPTQSNASIVGKSFEWVIDTPLGIQPLADDVYSIFMVFKANNFPSYAASDFNTILEFQSDTPGQVFDVELAYQGGNQDRAVITIDYGGGTKVAWDATGYGMDFGKWTLVQLDYSSAGNPSGNAQCYINNTFIGNSFLAVGLSTNKDTINVAQSFGGNLAAIGGYDRLLTSDERTQLYNYYKSRYPLNIS